MDTIWSPTPHEVTIMKSSRAGGTECSINNPVAYHIDVDPVSIMLFFPTLREGKEWSKLHFDPMVQSMPCLNKVHSDKIKDKRNEVLLKQFPGGSLSIFGANSTAGFRFRGAQFVGCTDIDNYEASLGDEGDPISLAKDRTKSFTNVDWKIVCESTPTTRDISAIEYLFFQGDQRHYHCPCPHCNYPQILSFGPKHQFSHLSNSYLKFDPHNLSWMHYECENCHKPIEEKFKTEMVSAGFWKPNKPEVVNHASFHISDMISPWITWMDMAKDFLKKRKSREKLRVFYNHSLGETFEEETIIDVPLDSLVSLCENYLSKDRPFVPLDVLVLTAGVDVQKDRLECIILGWGIGFECWFIERRIIYGSPERDSTWKDLDEYLKTAKWKHESGIDLGLWTTHGIQCVCVDSGYSATIVYEYIKSRQSRRFFATKGDDGFKKPFIISVKYEKRYRTRLAMIGVDSIKVRIYDRLAHTLKLKSEGTHAPELMHFNEYCNHSFFDELVSEKITIIKDKNGFPRRRWIKKNADIRNETLDCYTINFAAIELLKPNFLNLKRRLDERLKTISEIVAGDKQPPETPPSGNHKPPKPRGRKNWATNF